MRDVVILLVHLITIILRIARPGGLRSVVAESVLMKHQLLIVNRSRRRARSVQKLDLIDPMVVRALVASDRLPLRVESQVEETDAN